MKQVLCIGVSLLLGSLAAVAQEQAQQAPAAAPEGDKLISGMSVVGNHESPKSLVIVPWKSSELGTRLDVSKLVDDGRGPVDRDVFMRELDYYRISTE